MDDIKEKLLKGLNGKSREELEALSEKLQEYKKRKTENMCKSYVPNVKAEEFIKMVGSNEVFVPLFSAANGVGKSCCGANIVANICFGVQNDYFKGLELFEDFPYLKRGRIISDPTTLKEKIVPELKKWFPSNRVDVKYETSKEGKFYESRWVTDTGFEFTLMSSEQDTKEFESTDLGWVWIDEPLRREVYTATIARLRTGGILFWTMTPLSYSAWIKDEIYDKRDGKNADYVTATVWDNCKDIEGTRGMLSKADIDRMISQYPVDEAKARIDGEFGHTLGKVHKNFDRKIHVIEPFKIDPSNFVTFMALDTHPRVEEAVLWMAVDRQGTKYIIDELWFKGTDAEIAGQIKTIEKAGNMRIGDRLIDPSAFNNDKRSGEESFADRLMYLGLNFRHGSKNLIEGIRRTEEAFYNEVKEGQMIVKPEVYIFSNCVRLIKELDNYVWDEYKGKGSDERNPKPSPKDINDHFVEDLHRLLIEDFKFKEMKPVTMDMVRAKNKRKTSSFRQTSY